MSRYFLEIAYNGTNYNGWQTQPNGITVQETIEEKISVLLRVPHFIVGSGRTDAGVHAKQQFAHIEIEDDVLKISIEEFQFKLNRMLPDDIAILSVRRMVDSAHARFDATRRTYEYCISHRKNPFVQSFSYVAWHELDIERMKEAAGILFEYNDFSSFCKSHAGSKTTICKIADARWDQREDGVWVFTIAADRFLRNMVRAIVGTLVEIGRGKMTVEEFRHIIEQKDRRAAGNSAPAQGLFLVRVEYPDELFLK